jgi:phosphoserine aminotransferase
VGDHVDNFSSGPAMRPTEVLSVAPAAVARDDSRGDDFLRGFERRHG